MRLETKILSPNDTELSTNLAAVFSYWQSKCGDRFAPAWGDFRLDELDTCILPFCVVVDILGDPPDFVFRFFGTKRVLLQGRDFTGRSVSEFIPRNIGEKIERELNLVIEKRKPIFVVSEGTTNFGEPLSYEFLRLPLSADGAKIDKIFSLGFDEKSLRAIHRELGTELDTYPGTN